MVPPPISRMFYRSSGSSIWAFWSLVVMRLWDDEVIGVGYGVKAASCGSNFSPSSFCIIFCQKLYRTPVERNRKISPNVGFSYFEILARFSYKCGQNSALGLIHTAEFRSVILHSYL